MNNIKNYNEFVNESKSERKIVQDLARHLSFDKEVIHYLNTSKAKRTEGWRELLSRKLHGKQLDYVNYITKNMVADYNPRITGYVQMGSTTTIVDKDDDGFDTVSNKLSIGEIVNDVAGRVSDIENTLGIDPENAKTLDKVVDKLKEVGYEPDWDYNENDNEETETEEE